MKLEVFPSKGANMLKVTVERSKWHRGNPEYSFLRVPDHYADGQAAGKMCCLGFVCLAAGLTKEQITGKFYPHSLCHSESGGKDGIISQNKIIILYEDLPEVIQGLIENTGSGLRNTTCSTTMANTNDALHVRSEQEREDQITKSGLEAGIEFTFVD